MIKTLFLVLAVVMVTVALPLASRAQTSRPSVSGTEVTGTFKMNFRGAFKDFSNDIKIQALGGGKLRVAFDLVYPYTLRNGEQSVNMGSLDDTFLIKGDVAEYSTEDGECTIKIKFVRAGTIKVTQDGTDGACGFGHNVSSIGTYRKISGKKPVFEEN